MKNEKKFIRIESKINITVTMGLQHQNVSNPDAHVPDRLRIAPEWPNTTVDIRKGTGYYPSYIKDWDSVKALSENKILTLGELTDDCDNKEEVEKQMKELDSKIEEVKRKSNGFTKKKDEDEWLSKMSKVTNIDLSNLAGE